MARAGGGRGGVHVLEGRFVRDVYPKGDSGWEGYIDGLKAAGQFTPWDPASEAAQAYFANFPDGWKPLGYTTALGGKWLVPHNYESGLTLLFQ